MFVVYCVVLCLIQLNCVMHPLLNVELYLLQFILDIMHMIVRVYLKLLYFIRCTICSGRRTSRTNASKGITKNDIMPLEDIKIKHAISEGGSCEIYYAVHKTLNIVAVKKPKQDLKKLPELHDFHIQREARCLRRLSHPHIIQFHGLIWEPNFYAIVMEYIEEDLSTTVNRHRPHEWVKTKLLCDVARGVSYLHWLPKQIIHNDLKATNVLVNHQVVAKVCDFGLANWQSCSTLLYLNTDDHQLKPQGGTQTHISPERLLDINADSTKSDVYSFAILMWETYSEQRPFANCRSSEEIKQAVLNGNRPSLKSWPTSMVAEIIKDCWKQQAADRPEMSSVQQKFETFLLRPEVMTVVNEYVVKLINNRPQLRSTERDRPPVRELKRSMSAAVSLINIICRLCLSC